MMGVNSKIVTFIICIVMTVQTEAKMIDSSCLIRSETTYGELNGSAFSHEEELITEVFSDDMRIHSINTCTTS